MIYDVISEEIIYRSTDGVFIPVDPANMDYQRYLAWVSAGSPENEPLPEPVVESIPE